MKKQALRNPVLIAAILALQTGCGSNEQKTGNEKTVAVAPRVILKDTLKIYLEAKKMEIRVRSMVQAGAYDSAINRYKVCLSYLNQALQDNNNKGMYLYAPEFIGINQSMRAVYDSLKQPEYAVKSLLECLKWAKLTHDYQLQVKFDLDAAGKLKTIAANTDDTAKKGSLGREGLQYAMAGEGVIDSLKTNDMDDSKYGAYHLASQLCALLGDKKDAHAYDKKYKEVYFKIYKRMPKGD